MTNNVQRLAIEKLAQEIMEEMLKEELEEKKLKEKKELEEMSKIERDQYFEFLLLLDRCMQKSKDDAVENLITTMLKKGKSTSSISEDTDLPESLIESIKSKM